MLIKLAWGGGAETRLNYWERENTQPPLPKRASCFLRVTGQQLGGALTVQQLQRDGAVHVLPPVFTVRGHGDLPVGPLAGQVDADARDHRGPVLQAEGGEVQTARGRCVCGGCGGDNKQKENDTTVSWRLFPQHTGIILER